MKRIFFIVIVLAAISCTKENVSNSIVGNWLIIERSVGTGNSFSPSPIGTQRSLLFNANGTFQIEDADTTSFLHGFNRYSIQPDQKILFSSSTTVDKVIVDFNLNNNLSLFYPARCGFQEKFTRQ